MKTYKYKYETEEELRALEQEHSTLFIVGYECLLDGNYVVFSDKPIEAFQEVDKVLEVQSDKIANLEKEIVELKKFNAELVKTLNNGGEVLL